MKSLARIYFRLLAGMILRRYKPTVIAIAGSVGKTATKEAVAAAIANDKRLIRKTEGNFNGEVGVPATIMSGGGAPTSIAGWLGILWRGKKQAVFGGMYPEALVLELGADHPGDLAPLLHLARPTIGVLTSAAPEHLEFFGSEEGVVAEESLVVRQLPSDGTAVVNIDDPRVAEVVTKLKCKVISYGWSGEASIKAESIAISKDEHGLPNGMVAKVSLDGSTIPIALPGVLGRHQVYPILAAIAVGRVLGDEAMSVIQRLSSYVPPPGRMRLFHGRDGSLIIDDSYNASPEAVQAALNTLHELEIPGKRIAVLGQMSELGAAATEWHDRIGREITKLRVDVLVTVGPLADRIGNAAIEAGMDAKNVYNVANAEAAAATVQPMLTPGVAVLLKGSHFASQLEKAVAILLDNPERDQKFLVHS